MNDLSSLCIRTRAAVELITNGTLVNGWFAADKMNRVTCPVSTCLSCLWSVTRATV